MKEQMITSQGQKMNHSAINFVYNKVGNNDSMMNITQPLNMTTIIDKEK